jgi:hypothetical protein
MLIRSPLIESFGEKHRNAHREIEAWSRFVCGRNIDDMNLVIDFGSLLWK